VNFIIDSKPENYLNSIKSKENSKIFSSELKTGLKVEPYLDSNKTSEETHKLLNQMTIKSMNEELSQKSVIKPGFEQKYLIQAFRRSKRLTKKINKNENNKSLGKKWFNMTSNELNEEKKNDLLALSMRRGWDPKRFYKKNDSKDLPKFFQIGTVVETAQDFYHSRIPKKDRKRTLVEELLADSEFKKYNKKKYSEALAQNPYYLKIKRKKERQQLKAKGIDFKNKRNNKKNKKLNKQSVD
jgi:hypothetical protein